MNALFIVLAILIVVAAVLLTIVVLLQNGKGGGLASNFVAGNQTFGVRQTADILEKITWFLAAFILVLSIATNFTNTNSGKNGIDVTKEIQSGSQPEIPTFPVAPVQQEDPAQAATPTEE